MDSEPPTDLSNESTVPAARGSRFNPWLFFSILAAPGILAIIVFTFDSRDYGEKSLLTLIIGSAIAGLICGIHFTLAQRTMAVGLKVLIGIVAVIGCAGGAFALGMGGCFLFVSIMEGGI